MPPPSTLRTPLSSRRLAAVSLLSLSSGMPLGLVLFAMPAWMAFEGVDIKSIGLLTLAQAPWAFKFLWSPLLDRFRPPLLGGKRGWIVVWQLTLVALTLALATQASSPDIAMVGMLALAIAFASASQDIAIDAYAVETLLPHEQGLAVGARTAMYRAAMWFSGNIAISLAVPLGWRWVLGIQAATYLLLVPVTRFAPEAEVTGPPPKTLREAVWEPFVGFFRQNRAVEIAAFLVLYKLADNLAAALIRPFLVQVGYSAEDVGIGTGTVGLFSTIAGTFLGGALTTRLGVGRALWLFGVLQGASNAGYALVAGADVNRPLMYGAMGVEALTSGMGTGAFGVLLIRLTQKRFSATQFALLSSLFALGRTMAGPLSGVLVDALGWRNFFLLTILCAIPGLVMLQRFVPWGMRKIPPEAPHQHQLGSPISRRELTIRGVVGFVGGTLAGATGNLALAGLKAMREGRPFDPQGLVAGLLHPTRPSDWVDLLGPLVFGVVTGFAVASSTAARRGSRGSRS